MIAAFKVSDPNTPNGSQAVENQAGALRPSEED
jgi:hypothetical protein